MSVAELLAHEPDPDEAQIRDVLSGHLCRCTGYQNIVDAVRLAARLMRGERMSGVGPVGPVAATGMGAGTPRIEDAALLRGEARFLDDIPVAMPLHACFVRSPMRTPASCRSTCPPRGPCQAWRPPRRRISMAS